MSKRCAPSGALPSGNSSELSINDWLVAYAGLGWRLVPLQGKQPTMKNWPSKASSAIGKIRGYFRNHKNIGVVSGGGSGIVVIDIDPRNGGDISLKRMERDLGKLPETVTAITGGGGKHFVFRYFDNAKSCVAADGIDFLSDGKQFVVAPSIHPQSKLAYRWEISPFDSEVAELPDAWQDLLCKPKEGIKDDTRTLCEGERNSGLLNLAGRLKREGQSLKQIETRLIDENLRRCDPPLDYSEVISLAARIGGYDNNKPIKTKWQEQVLASDMNPYGKVALLALSTYSDKDGGSCFPTQEQVAERANMSAKTVRNHLDKAYESGWFKRQTRGRSAGVGYSYQYVLTVRPEPFTDLDS